MGGKLVASVAIYVAPERSFGAGALDDKRVPALPVTTRCSRPAPPPASERISGRSPRSPKTCSRWARASAHGTDTGGWGQRRGVGSDRAAAAAAKGGLPQLGLVAELALADCRCGWSRELQVRHGGAGVAGL